MKAIRPGSWTWIVVVAAIVVPALGIPSAQAAVSEPGTAAASAIAPRIQQGASLAGVSAVSSTDAWAVGYARSHRTGVARPLILHWDGTAWSKVTTPHAGTGDNLLTGVSALSGSDAWAVGYFIARHGGAHALILHWNGMTWSRVTSPTPRGLYLFGVSAGTSTDAWAVGFRPAMGNYRTLILHWDGRVWTTIASPNPGGLDIALFGVSALSSTDAWAVGYFQTRGGADRTLVLRWDGVAWSKVPSGDNPGRYTNIMYGVSAASSTDVWAVGSYDRAGERPLLLHWDGRAWSRVASPGSAGSELLAVDTVSSTEAWAVGYFVAQRGGRRTLTLHWDGRGWSKVSSPSPGFDNVASGVSAVSSTDAWTVGSYEGATPSHKLMLHWDGDAWSRLRDPG